jgi:hypothetical protein
VLFYFVNVELATSFNYSYLHSQLVFAMNSMTIDTVLLVFFLFFYRVEVLRNNCHKR